MSHGTSKKVADDRTHLRKVLKKFCYVKKEPLGSFHVKSQTSRLGSQP